jgi:hypothetical protein
MRSSSPRFFAARSLVAGALAFLAAAAFSRPVPGEAAPLCPAAPGVQADASGPDLTGSWRSLRESCRGKGKQRRCHLNGTFVVRNAGDQGARSSALCFFLSEDTTLDPGDRLLKTVHIRPLRSGQRRVSVFTIRLPRAVSAAGKYVLGVVDATNVVAETDETNNVQDRGPL